MRRFAPLAFLVFAACGTDPDTPKVDATCEPAGVGEAPLRKLTRTEYQNTVLDVTGVAIAADNIVQDPRIHGFDNAAVTVNVGLLAADGYLRSSETISEAYDWRVWGCAETDPESQQRDCALAFIEAWGRLAFRRTLDPTEVGIYLDLYDLVRADEGFTVGLQAVMQAVLQSPQFLYRPEVGDGQPANNGRLRLSDHELATRLSYLLWESAPDAALLDRADAGELANPDILAAEVDRLLNDPRARAAMGHFVEQWVGTVDVEAVTKDAVLHPQWGPELARDLREETRRFAGHVVFDGDGSLYALLSAPYTIANANVAAQYGAKTLDWTVLELDPDKRAGLLTHPGLMASLAHANQTSIVKRGAFVRERLLCQTLTDPPDELDISLPPLDDTLTARERFARHAQDPACSGCHELTDPVGLGFEHYDTLGRWREVQGSDLPVLAEGAVLYSPDGEVDGPFYGAPELARRLAGSHAVQRCFVDNTFRVAWARDPLEADACTLDTLDAGMTESGGNVQDLLRAVATHPDFAVRPEVTP